ncbi:hypothetical protein [Paenibacillus sinopodophylli]|uniref:phage adaptor protein n=1 Tax=Paenibacillus sinopodophylli TaxID=1837342 RepID=UPI00110CEA95|nr:hypothetical protein [Paenibacillus sinopodophylli]
MAVTLGDIRSVVIRETGMTVIEHESIINWCNDANMDIGVALNVPATTFQIALTTTDLSYALPVDAKEINRLWLESDIDAGINRDLSVNYRIYNGLIEFPIAFPTLDTLNIDYYKILTYFTTETDVIDFPDRYITIYTSYCKMRYYELFSTQEKLGQVATLNYDRSAQIYQSTKRQIIQNYSFTNPDLTIKERW